MAGTTAPDSGLPNPAALARLFQRPSVYVRLIVRTSASPGSEAPPGIFRMIRPESTASFSLAVSGDKPSPPPRVADRFSGSVSLNGLQHSWW